MASCRKHLVSSRCPAVSGPVQRREHTSLAPLVCGSRLAATWHDLAFPKHTHDSLPTHHTYYRVATIILSPQVGQAAQTGKSSSIA